MAIKAINLTRTVRYESDLDPAKGTEDATVFVIGALDARVMGALKDKATEIPMAAFTNAENAMANLNASRTNFDIVVYGLRGLENFLDEDGKPVEYKTVIKNLGGKAYQVIDPEIVNKFEPDLIDELAGRISNFNQLTEEERKN